MLFHEQKNGVGSAFTIVCYCAQTSFLVVLLMLQMRYAHYSSYVPIYNNVYSFSFHGLKRAFCDFTSK